MSKTRSGVTRPAIMFQGTSSNAGKSVLAAGFCRMLLQDGYRPAPFKSQNMSLNSYVTLDGGEMGRAQVTQAQACGLEPDVRMNPVLLKPSSDVGSQVLVMGRPVGVMRVREYVEYKPRAFDAARKAYDELAAEHDVMVLEGAGSPAEINLKAHDIVNMRMAEYAGAHVLLVGDIDRGGVFASLVGTMELLDQWERDLVAGFVLNRFRGDPSLLDPALEMTTARTGKPFVGVVPHVVDLGLPEEDSVSFKQGLTASSREGEVRVVLVDLPHISNFTDIDALASEPDVRCDVARTPRDLEGPPPDAVILPGSKNTIQDLLRLRESGIADRVLEFARTGTCEIVGICGGLQMLGKHLADPLGLESAEKQVPGLGLLPLRTELGRDKVLTRTTATHRPSGLTVRGYEIHHGSTRLLQELEGSGSPFLVDEAGNPVGYASGLIWGTYLHGVFDDDVFRRWFVNRLRERKGKPPLGRSSSFSMEPALDRLADTMRANMDWKTVYSLLGLG